MKSRARFQAALALVLSVAGVLGFAAPAQAALTYFYVTGVQNYTTTGVAVLVTVAKPTLASGDFHSLMEVAVSTVDQQQVVEAGWTVDTVGGNPHLFVGRWTNGVFGGYSDATWIDYASNPINRGADINGAVGTLKQFNIQYQSVGIDTGWWVFYDGVGIGHFPASDWTSPTFVTATRIQEFGEVAANVAAPITQMGTGACGATGTGAKFSSTQYADGTVGVDLSVTDTNSTKYSHSVISKRSFWAGGDGSCP